MLAAFANPTGLKPRQIQLALPTSDIVILVVLELSHFYYYYYYLQDTQKHTDWRDTKEVFLFS